LYTWRSVLRRLTSSVEGIGFRGRIAWGILLILVLMVLVFASMRPMVDVPNLASGTTPDPEAFDVHHHRRWMILAFAVGMAVGTIRLWIGLFEATGLLSFRDAFGVAFWLSFVLHAAAAELWLRWRPAAQGFVAAS
jgi:hypothetical protein